MCENVMGADNQQERLNPEWISGFVDGEGCFTVSINKHLKMRLQWQVLPEFRVVQHQRDTVLLQRIRNYFCFGTVTKNNGDRNEYRVRGLNNLETLVKFFQQHSLQSVKRIHFNTFAFILRLMRKKVHLTEQGLREIAALASTMNRKIPRRV